MTAENHQTNPMFSPSPYQTPATPRHNRARYTPTRSSPLSPRQSNSNASSIFFPQRNSMLPSPPKTPTPKRAFKTNPVLYSREEGREARRNLFLKKVRNSRDEKVMKARGGEDEMMRMIFVSEKKRWEATQARAAAKIPTIYEEESEEPAYEDDDDDEDHWGMIEDFTEGQLVSRNIGSHGNATHSGGRSQSDNLDAILDKEGQELEALLSGLDLDLDQVMPDDDSQWDCQSQFWATNMGWGS